jgi:hypothetical protein
MVAGYAVHPDVTRSDSPASGSWARWESAAGGYAAALKARRPAVLTVDTD